MIKRLLLFAFILLSGLTKVWADNGTKRAKAGEIDDSKLIVADDTCSKNRGSITGLAGNSNLTYQWRNSSGTSIATTLSVKDLAGGEYTLTYFNSATRTTGTYGPVIVKSFSTPVFDRTGLKITATTCGKNEGAITGLKVIGSRNLRTLWTSDFDRSKTYTTLNLVNVPPGKYELIIADDCAIAKGGIYTIPSIGGIDLDTSKVAKANETCGQKNGSITGLSIRNRTFNEVISWKDSRGAEVSNTLDVKNLTSGYYTLTVVYDNLSCPITYGPVYLKNDGGPVIDESKAYTLLANCICDSGSILGITAKGTGKLTYEWISSQGYTASTDLDFKRAKCEAYMLKVTDESGCGSVYSALYRVSRPPLSGDNTSPIADFSKMVITKGTCSTNASVTGMTWQCYSNCHWEDAQGNILTRGFDLIDVPSGAYRFYIEDPCGHKRDVDFDLGPRPLKFANYEAVVTNICGTATTGSLKIVTGADVVRVRWVNAAGAQVGEGNEITGLPAGEYHVFLTNYFGCEADFKTYTIKKVMAPQITPGSALVTNERCDSKTGSIKNIKVTGGVLPYHYNWLNSAGKVIDTLLDVKGLSAGTYTLVIRDSGGCTISGADYQIINDTGDLPLLVIGTINVCDPGDVVISAGPVADGYKYRLYESATSPAPIAEEASGKFKVQVDADRSFFVSQAIGTCESARTEVHILTGLKTPKVNAFSPNGDGINDYWKIPGIELFPKASVMVFTRAGEKVFESVGYTTPFNGTYNGRQLTPGTYYYVINPNTGCSFRSGNLTIIR